MQALRGWNLEFTTGVAPVYDLRIYQKEEVRLQRFCGGIANNVWTNHMRNLLKERVSGDDVNLALNNAIFSILVIRARGEYNFAIESISSS